MHCGEAGHEKKINEATKRVSERFLHDATRLYREPPSKNLTKLVIQRLSHRENRHVGGGCVARRVIHVHKQAVLAGLLR